MATTLVQKIERDPKVTELVEYVSELGFKHEGRWYFRGTWMNNSLLHNFKDEGFVVQVGTFRDLTEMGIKVPADRERAYSKAHHALYYRVIDGRAKKILN